MSAVKITNKSLPEIDFKALENLGYSQSEISAALSWIINDTEYKGKFTVANAPNSDNPLRIMIDSERDIFTPESMSELNNYVNLGIISYEQMEYIIERLSAVGVTSLDKEMLKTIVAAILFSQYLSDPSNMNVILHGNEAVN